jgi:hypothetical protein
MSVLPVESAASQTRSSGRRRSEDEIDSLFDRVKAMEQAAATTFVEATAEQGLPAWAAVLPQTQLAPPAELTTPPIQASAQGTRDAAHANGGLMRVDSAYSDARTTPKHDRLRLADEASYVQHGTLPVIVAGQLIELSLLRERRSARDSVLTRRLSIVLDSSATPALVVDAHVHDDELVIAFSGSCSQGAPRLERHAHEIRALAGRLGWSFSAMRWESDT